MFRLSIFDFCKFDKITKFRLINAFWFAFIIGLTSPVLSHLKGLLSVTVLSIIAIGAKLMMKTNDWFDKKFTLSEIYKLGTVLNIAFLCSTTIYFYNPKTMILLDSILSVIEFGIFSVYSIKLNEYITKYHPNSFKSFQKVRNATWADGTLLGLFITMVLSSFFNEKNIVMIALVIWTAYVIRLIWFWNIYQEEKFATI